MSYFCVKPPTVLLDSMTPDEKQHEQFSQTSLPLESRRNPQLWATGIVFVLCFLFCCT